MAKGAHLPIARVRSRQPRRGISDADKVDLALHRFSIDPDTGAFTSLEAVAAAAGRDPAVVSKAVVAAFREHLVEVQRVDGGVKRNELLEKRIQLRFPHLPGVRVIQSPPRTFEVDERKYSDTVHRSLGIALALDISRGLVISGPVRNIGLGSGRSVFYTVESLKTFRRLPWSDTILTSLSGAMLARDHATQVSSYLDADLHVNLFALCIDRGDVQMRFVSHDVAHPSRDECLRAKAQTPLSEATWSESHPNYAIVGVGVFAAGHGFYEATRSYRSERRNEQALKLEPILSILDELWPLCDELRKLDPAYCPVGDVCNHLFLVPHPSLTQSYRSKLTTLLDKANARLLNVTREQIAQVDHLIILAGTQQKAAAILELIENRERQPDINIQMLYIDSETAIHMLRFVAGRAS